MVLLEFFIDIILPAALWSCDRPGLQQNWVPEIFPAGKGVWCFVLTTSTLSCADCVEIWDIQTPGTLWGCNRTEEGLLYLSFSSAIPFLQTSGSQSWPYGPRFDHTKSPKGHSNFWVGLPNFTAWMNYFKFKPEWKVPHPPLCNPHSTGGRIKFIDFPLFDSGWSGWIICCQKSATAFLSWGQKNFPHFSQTLKNLQGLIRSKEHAGYNDSY